MIKKITFFIVFALAIAACNQAVKTDTSAADGEKAEMNKNTFGETISESDAISYDALASQMKSSDSLAVKVKATVNEVCQAKGCWMTLSSPDSKAEEMMVKFKDYGFFVPKDIAGREVIIEGHAFREVTPVDELRHYAEDAGKSKEEIEKINTPKEEYKFLASGVLLLDEKEGGK